MPQRNIIVVGASLGGVEFLPRLAATLPAGLPASILVVQHILENESSQLPRIINRSSRIPFTPAVDGEELVQGRGYVGVPGVHLMVESGRIRLARGPKECRARPSVDVLFRSAAYEYGPRVIGIVMSGNLDDGTAGLWAIKDRGGIAIIQSPEEAPYASMPANALRHVQVDYTLRVDDMGKVLESLTTEEVGAMEEKTEGREKMQMELGIATADSSKIREFKQLGPPVNYTCPECHGSMVRINEGSNQRYRCHTGHAFGDASLNLEQTEAVESALWQALAKMEERELLLRDQAKRSRDTGLERQLAQAEELKRLGTKLREILKEPVIASSSA